MDRKKVLVHNVSLSVVYKIVGLLLVFLTIPLLIDFLESERYGVWVTIFSITNMVFFADFGLGNGLKTRLTHALSSKNRAVARLEISHAYIFIGVLAVTVFLLGWLIMSQFDLQIVLNTTVSNSELQRVFMLTLGLICIGFVLNIYKSMYYATQEAAKVELSLLIYNLGIVAIIIAVLQYYSQSLFIIALIYGGMNVLIGSIFSLLFFRRNPDLLPNFKFFSVKEMKGLLNLSSSFFIIQLSMVVIFTTDNVIISHLLGPTEVTKYDIVRKLFNTLITIIVIAQGPLWSLFTDAYAKGDFKWIKKTLIWLNKLFIPVVIIITLLVLATPSIIEIWIGPEMSIPMLLTILMGVFVGIRVYGTIYMSFLNGIGRIKAQMWFYFIGAAINIPLSIYFVQSLGLGLSGVILGTIASLLLLTIAVPIQSFRILQPND